RLQVLREREERACRGERQEPEQRRVGGDQDPARRKRRMRGQLGGRRARRGAQLRSLAAQVDEPQRLLPYPRRGDLPLVLAIGRFSQTGERGGKCFDRGPLRNPSREYLVPAGWTVPAVHVGPLGQELEAGGIAPAPGERERLVDGVEEQLGEVQRRLVALREPFPQPAL